MQEVYIRDEYIKLEQAMKLSGACSSGSDAKYEILGSAVTVNGEKELRRGRKLYANDRFEYLGTEYVIKSANP